MIVNHFAQINLYLFVARLETSQDFSNIPSTIAFGFASPQYTG